MGEADGVRFREEALERIGAAPVEPKHFGHQRRPDRVGFNAMRRRVVDVTDGGHRRPMALLGLLAHPLLHLFAQVVDVVLCHQHLDAVHELSDERDSRQTTVFSLTKWTVTSSSSMLSQSLML